MINIKVLLRIEMAIIAFVILRSFFVIFGRRKIFYEVLRDMFHSLSENGAFTLIPS